jgi:membrane-bound ClpP family serine protease
VDELLTQLRKVWPPYAQAVGVLMVLAGLVLLVTELAGPVFGVVAGLVLGGLAAAALGVLREAGRL